MPLSYNPTDFNRVVDLSSTINIVPNQWGLFNQLGIFDRELKSQKTVLIPRFEMNEALIGDRNWDERNNANGKQDRDYLLSKIPHFPLDDAITPNDIDGVVAWENVFAGIQTESIASTRTRKMVQMRMNHARTLEYARSQLITTGTVYAPNGTLKTSYGPTVNFYTEFGITRTELTMDLTNLAVDPLAEVEPIIAAIQDGLLSGDAVNAFVAVASPEFFNALITHPFVVDTYKYQLQTQSTAILNGRLTANAYGLDARYRTFDYGGILFIEYRGSFGGTAYIPAGDAYVFPVGGEAMFKTYHAPANRFATVNQVAQEAYWFEYMNEKDDLIEIMSESNFLNAILRPQALVRVSIAP
jgi:hypothetical protein